MWMRPGLLHLEGEMDLSEQRGYSGARRPVGRTFFLASSPPSLLA